MKGYLYLNAMIPICKVIHRFVLFVNDAYTSFMRTNCYGLDIFYRFPLLFQIRVDEFGGFDGSLRVELSWCETSACRSNPEVLASKFYLGMRL